MKFKEPGRAPGRRSWLACAAATSVALSAVVGIGASAGATPKNPFPKSLSGSFAFYSGGDTNIQQLWQNVLIPRFSRAYPHIKVNYVFDEHGTDDVTTLDRVAVAVKDHKPSGYALLESATNAVELGARQNLFIPINSKKIPNSANVPASYLSVVHHDAVPYRGSKVVLAYDSSKVTNPPTTLAQLLSWIQANPGKFAYCSPAGGGSGSYFVQSVLDSYMPQADITKLAFNDDTALESLWKPGLAELHKLNTDVYGAGTYPTGNTQVLSLLESGAIEMATVWSDQGTQAKLDGQLGPSVKLTDLTPPFAGSPVYLGIPRYTRKSQVVLAEAFLNFVLSVNVQARIVKAVAGFPGINLSVMTKGVKSEFASLGESEQLPYAATISDDLNRIWQQDVP
ncbi:MAG: extracellular solute-binding protein [Acidimicrobiales bacterium]